MPPSVLRMRAYSSHQTGHTFLTFAWSYSRLSSCCLINKKTVAKQRNKVKRTYYWCYRVTIKLIWYGPSGSVARVGGILPTNTLTKTQNILANVLRTDSWKLTQLSFIVQRPHVQCVFSWAILEIFVQLAERLSTRGLFCCMRRDLHEKKERIKHCATRWWQWQKIDNDKKSMFAPKNWVWRPKNWRCTTQEQKPSWTTSKVLETKPSERAHLRRYFHTLPYAKLFV